MLVIAAQTDYDRGPSKEKMKREYDGTSKTTMLYEHLWQY